jgi:hypothetical protein
VAGNIWECKIGEAEGDSLPEGSDAPMRRAVIKAYEELTGKEPRFAFTGWAGSLDETEREIVEED